MRLLDVLWLRRFVHLHDHAPLEFVRSAAGGGQSPICPLYLYETDQLSEPTVHGSHVALVSEGLVDMDQQVVGMFDGSSAFRCCAFSLSSSSLVPRNNCTMYNQPSSSLAVPMPNSVNSRQRIFLYPDRCAAMEA